MTNSQADRFLLVSRALMQAKPSQLADIVVSCVDIGNITALSPPEYYAEPYAGLVAHGIGYDLAEGVADQPDHGTVMKSGYAIERILLRDTIDPVGLSVRGSASSGLFHRPSILIRAGCAFSRGIGCAPRRQEQKFDPLSFRHGRSKIMT